MKQIYWTPRLVELVKTISANNPSAIDICKDIIRRHDDIQDDRKFLWALRRLHMLELYGTDLVTLYNDVCRRSMVNLLIVLRARTMHLLKDIDIMNAVWLNGKRGAPRIRFNKLYEKIKEEVPTFDRADHFLTP